MHLTTQPQGAVGATRANGPSAQDGPGSPLPCWRCTARMSCAFEEQQQQQQQQCDNTFSHLARPIAVHGTRTASEDLNLTCSNDPCPSTSTGASTRRRIASNNNSSSSTSTKIRPGTASTAMIAYSYSTGTACRGAALPGHTSWEHERDSASSGATPQTSFTSASPVSDFGPRLGLGLGLGLGIGLGLDAPIELERYAAAAVNGDRNGEERDHGAGPEHGVVYPSMLEHASSHAHLHHHHDRGMDIERRAAAVAQAIEPQRRAFGTHFSRDLGRRIEERRLMTGPGNLAAALGFASVPAGLRAAGEEHQEEEMEEEEGAPAAPGSRSLCRAERPLTRASSSPPFSSATHECLGARSSVASLPDRTLSSSSPSSSSLLSFTAVLHRGEHFSETQGANAQTLTHTRASALLGSPIRLTRPRRSRCVAERHPPSSASAGAPALTVVPSGVAAPATPLTRSTPSPPPSSRARPHEPPARSRRSDRRRGAFARRSPDTAAATDARPRLGSYEDSDSGGDGDSETHVSEQARVRSAPRSPTAGITSRCQRWLHKHRKLLALSIGQYAESVAPGQDALALGGATYEKLHLTAVASAGGGVLVSPCISSLGKDVSHPRSRSNSLSCSFSDKRRKRQFIPPSLDLGPSLFAASCATQNAASSDDATPPPTDATGCPSPSTGGIVHSQGAAALSSSPVAQHRAAQAAAAQDVHIFSAGSPLSHRAVIEPSSGWRSPDPTAPATLLLAPGPQAAMPPVGSDSAACRNNHSLDQPQAVPSSARSVQAIVRMQRDALQLFSEAVLEPSLSAPSSLDVLAPPVAPHSAPASAHPRRQQQVLQGQREARKCANGGLSGYGQLGLWPAPSPAPSLSPSPGPHERVSRAWLQSVQQATTACEVSSREASRVDRLPPKQPVFLQPRGRSAAAACVRAPNPGRMVGIASSRSQDFSLAGLSASASRRLLKKGLSLRHHASSPRIADPSDGEFSSISTTTTSSAAIEALIQQLKFPTQQEDGAAMFVNDLRDRHLHAHALLSN
ncbi:hypothetical protein K437DRAFT_262918 [Tilletiaria anomala UBC 951]|uniref:Uncharacterized protein n=1 Tax=Tilletiaria anomala (strain ATCC 24038 / CBS 436.72 / UBC 951) TaxID=1037660 RepID=A0A066VVE5_TILAU|nr:uncharacterized protein K437DRAFT_262918 [Tilletiaria anomala UBC 951]KDN45441.1 hypothetical protein K437DRAFT_262918 [Tilletiaria anomala UBC 951]